MGTGVQIVDRARRVSGTFLAAADEEERQHLGCGGIVPMLRLHTPRADAILILMAVCYVSLYD